MIAGIRGSNAGLEAALDEVFAGSFPYEGKQVPAMPADPSEREAALQDYYASMEKTND